MSALKYSRQRESIKTFLSGRTDHPTAEVIYTALREDQPHISLGTVYRNLSLLTQLGEIRKISTGDGPEHYDGDTTLYHHFICKNCHRVMDLWSKDADRLVEAAAKSFHGQIEGCCVNFYGLCEDCLKKFDAS